MRRFLRMHFSPRNLRMFNTRRLAFVAGLLATILAEVLPPHWRALQPLLVFAAFSSGWLAQ
jgi:hypothetical protein